MLSIPHLTIILLVAFIVLGPEKLPQVARTLGRMMADFRRVTADFRTTIEGEVREIERQAQLREAAAAAQAEVNTALEAVGSVARDVSRTGAEPAQQSPASSGNGAEPQPPTPAQMEEPVAAVTHAPPEKLTNG